jgi:hypothetical protein
VTINVLHADVLVEIFFYVITWGWNGYNPWHALVHVCRRWRYLVFASPRHLNLQLEYSGHRPISEVLDAWPVLPIKLVSNYSYSESYHPKLDQRRDNRIAALESEHSNRICEIRIGDMADSDWQRFAAATQKPFPELTHLTVVPLPYDDMVSVLLDSFLGGSAPRLRTLVLRGIPFPSIPKLLSSANGLVILILEDIPDSGYFSPDALATVLTAMTRLEYLSLYFRSRRSLPDRENRPLAPPTLFVLPALTELWFGGVYEYLEVLLARIDAPLLHDLHILFNMDPDFYVPQLHRFIGHGEEFKAFNHGEVSVFDYSMQLDLYPETGGLDHQGLLRLHIAYTGLDWRLSFLPRVCSPSLSLISTMEKFHIRESDDSLSSYWIDDMEDTQWLELLDPFTSLKDLYLTRGVARRVCGALQELSGERATKVLPALRNLFVQGSPSSLQPVQESMMPFVAARRLSGHPVAIHHWQ